MNALKCQAWGTEFLFFQVIRCRLPGFLCELGLIFEEWIVFFCRVIFHFLCRGGLIVIANRIIFCFQSYFCSVWFILCLVISVIKITSSAMQDISVKFWRIFHGRAVHRQVYLLTDYTKCQVLQQCFKSISIILYCGRREGGTGNKLVLLQYPGNCWTSLHAFFNGLKPYYKCLKKFP